ncbi:hypothetical protein A7K69_01635 [Parageobacillus thermoglucosidasius]|uniref:Uncharacterized protein n=1 Tax=Parageobacillus thermoglucosidasius TaxID=1426 RepID=A0A1B7KWD9_PARTM|nr:hypothetical protein A7K69_01635 [Parageobacillus thermoglucosidasius]
MIAYSMVASFMVLTFCWQKVKIESEKLKNSNLHTKILNYPLPITKITQESRLWQKSWESKVARFSFSGGNGEQPLMNVATIINSVVASLTEFRRFPFILLLIVPHCF